MNSGLILTFILGLFILLGSYIVFKTDNSDKIVNFSLSLAFGAMTGLIWFELIPEAYENLKGLGSKGIWMIIGYSLLGLVILKILDLFVPDHDHSDDCEEDKHHLFHIGLVSSIALILHNIIEGMAIYTIAIADAKLAILASIGVGLHNIPLGMVITSTMYKANNDKTKTLRDILIISLSTFVGGIIMCLLAGNMVSSTILGILLSITTGMLLYIVIFELLMHIVHSKDKKTTWSGIALGIIILIISVLFDKL